MSKHQYPIPVQGKPGVFDMKIEDIQATGGTQIRANIDQDAVNDYAEHVDDLPPAEVYHDGTPKGFWLVDGFHRYFAHKKSGRQFISVAIKSGTRREAILAACGVNSSHGMRRTNEDKRNAVMTLLRDEEWQNWGDSEIAKKCGVAQSFARKLRATTEPILNSELSMKSENPASLVQNVTSETYKVTTTDDATRTFTHPKTGKPTEMKIGNIGKKKGVESPAPSPESAPPKDGTAEGSGGGADSGIEDIAGLPGSGDFNANIDGIVLELRAVAARLRTVCESRYGHYFGQKPHEGILAEARRLEHQQPAGVDDKPPGFISAQILKTRTNFKKAA
jgi:hypothetical protein